jgi:citrate lyase subunit beta/citryl-CoA lyase
MLSVDVCKPKAPMLSHPDNVLFQSEKPFPVIAACEHYAGSEKFIRKAFELQNRLGPVFDINCDCEDGATPGNEHAHAAMIVTELQSSQNAHARAGVRIHDVTHPAWQDEVDQLVEGVGNRLAFISLPKANRDSDIATMVDYIEKKSQRANLTHAIALHVIVETPGALRDVMKIGALPGLQAIAFGQLDFISGHHGAIPMSAMHSPGQFEHVLIRRAKAEIVEAALTNGLVPTHSLTLGLTDTSRVYADAHTARSHFGFLRMWSIHPAQIAPIIDAMKPDFSEVEFAAAVLLEAQQAHWAPIRHQGKLQEAATYRFHWELLKRAKVTGVVIPPEALAAFFS